MLGSGVITVSAVSETAKETATTWGTPLQRRGRKRQPSHMYYQLKPSKIFDCSAFFNEEGFTINYDEEHILLPNCHLMIYHASINNEGPVTVDNNNVPIYMCFKIRLITPGMSLHVGKHTPMNLLLHCAQLDIVQLGLTSKQVVEMREPYTNATVAANASRFNQQSAAKKPRHDVPPPLLVSQIPLPPPPPPPHQPTNQLERPTWLNFNSPELSPA